MPGSILGKRRRRFGHPPQWFAPCLTTKAHSSWAQVKWEQVRKPPGTTLCQCLSTTGGGCRGSRALCTLLGPSSPCPALGTHTASPSWSRQLRFTQKRAFLPRAETLGGCHRLRRFCCPCAPHQLPAQAAEQLSFPSNSPELQQSCLAPLRPYLPLARFRLEETFKVLLGRDFCKGFW